MGKTYKDINNKYKSNKDVEYFKFQRKSRRLARGQKHYIGDTNLCEVVANKRLLTDI